jgi:hypothetical protein
MRRAPVILLILAAAYAGFGAAAKKRRAAASHPPAVTRASALKAVDRYLAASANTELRQPGSLVPFFEQLARLGSGESRDPVHIIHFGDSHTAADEWTGELRDLLKARFGDGGSGFSVAGHPFAGYRRFDARGGASSGWQSEGLRKAEGDGYFGLGGISIASDRPGEIVWLNADCDRIEVDYLQQPGGGSLALYDNDQQVKIFSTDGELGPGFAEFEIPGGQHRFTLKTIDARPVRLFGWVVDKDAGITYEALGINGAEAPVIMRWNAAMLATYLQRRNPGMIVLAYGTNEASDPAWSGGGDYEAAFASLLQRLRSAVPAASILVIGPGDRWARYRGVWKEVPGVDDIISAQRAACKAARCAFWDTRERMGGKGSMRDWVAAGLAQNDRVHFTEAGYHKLANALFEDLMRQFSIYQKTRTDSDK